MMKSGRRNKSFYLKLIFSVGLLVFIFTRVSINSIITILLSIKLFFFFLAILFDILERFLLAYKWNMILAVKKIKFPFLEVVKIYFISTFIGTIFPSGLGGDIFRIYRLHQSGSSSSDSISSIFTERTIAFVSSLTISFISVSSYFMIIGSNQVIINVLVIIIVCSCLLFIISTDMVMKYPIIFIKTIGFKNAQKKIDELYEAIISYKHHKLTLFYVLVLSFLFQFVRIIVAYTGSLALNQHVSIVYFFIFIPIIILAGMIPISLGGIGIREGAFIYFFSQAGMSPSESFTLSLLLYVVTILAMLPGAIIYFGEGIITRGKCDSGKLNAY